MEDQSTTITTNIPETLVGERLKRIEEVIKVSTDFSYREVKITSATSPVPVVSSIIISFKSEPRTWLAIIIPSENRVILKNSGKIPFDDKSESAILSLILKYYYD